MSNHLALGPMKNRRGAVIPIVAVCMVMLIGFAAVAIDIGLLFDSRAEAQRTADAAALAGASVLLSGHLKGKPLNEQQDSATARAVAYAGMNKVRGVNVDPGDVAVTFPTNARIVATITRGGISPIFASIFGVADLKVAASAHAMWYQGNAASCIRPFGVPDTSSITITDIGREVLIWRKDAKEYFPLFRQFDDGNNVRDAIESQTCDATVVNVGNVLSHNEASNNTAVSQGQVKQGIDELFRLDKDLDYDPAKYGDKWDGFNRPDWRASPRVLTLILYDHGKGSNTEFHVSGFMTVFLPKKLVAGEKGDQLLYGIVLPHKAFGPPCLANCSALSFNFRLVQ